MGNFLENDGSQSEPNQIERDFDSLLKPDYTIQVWRTAPANWTGYLDRITIQAGDDMVSIFDEIIERFGGQSYKLKLCNEKGQYVSQRPFECRSYPPKLEGRDLRKQDFPPPPNPEQAPIVQRLEHPVRTLGSVEEMGTVFDRIERMMERLDQKNAEMIKTIVATVAPKSSPSILSGVDEILSFTEKMQVLKKAFGAAEGAIQDNPESTQLFSLLSNVATQLFQPAAPQVLPAGQGALPPRQPATQPATRRQQPVQHAPQTGAQTQPTEDEARRFLGYLGAQPAEQIADVFWAFVDNMPDSKRNNILSRIDSRLSEEREVDLGDDEKPDETDPNTETTDEEPGGLGVSGPSGHGGPRGIPSL